MGELTHIDLFSGIGGFALACRWNGIKTVQFVEIDKFCQKVLNKNFPGVPIEPDIKQFDGKKYAGSFILTGGFPCQPFSCAGKRNGKEDDRFLWPEMLRVISEVRPRWIIGENVAGIINMELDNCISDLEREGYEVQTFIIPACAVNAPHRRDRVWIVANSGQFREGRTKGGFSNGKQSGETEREWSDKRDGFTDKDCHAADTDTGQRLQRHENETIGSGRETRQERGGCVVNVPNSEGERLEGSLKTDRKQGQKPHDEQLHGCCGEWNEPWLEVAQRFCQLDARISNRLDGCLTLLETHGIMGFILMLRRYHYATSKETRTREVLPILQEAFGEESVQRCFGRLSEVFEAQNLWCPVHGKIDGEREENEIGIPEGGCEVSRKSVREVRDGKEYRNPSQGRRLDKQCTCEFDDIVFELSSEIALGEWKRNSKKAENILFNLWKKSRGERFLYEPLPALYEIWRSVTDQEIGAFRRHYNMRDRDRAARLKALGNAVVPQIVEIIGRAIMEIEKA
jgi:DNA-cytosine methyltransferase